MCFVFRLHLRCLLTHGLWLISHTDVGPVLVNQIKYMSHILIASQLSNLLGQRPRLTSDTIPPRPRLASLTPTLPNAHGGHSPQSMARSNAKLVAARCKASMTFFQTDLDINTLRERPRNQKTEIARLQAYIDNDLSHEAAQAVSAAWIDKNGVILATYFAHQILEPPSDPSNQTQSPSPSSQASTSQASTSPCSNPLDSHVPTGAKVVRIFLYSAIHIRSLLCLL